MHLDTELFKDRKDLEDEINKQSAKWISLVEMLSDEDLEENITYVDTSGIERTGERARLLQHVFNQYVLFLYRFSKVVVERITEAK